MKSANTSLVPVYVANVTCGMGIMGFIAAADSLADLLKLEAWQIGLTATAGGVGWIMSARPWGRAADSIGRKKVLVIGISGFSLAFLSICIVAQAGISFALTPVYMVVGLSVTRLVSGLFYPAITAAGVAMVADQYEPDARAGAMSRLGASQAAGFVLGPAFVAVFAGPLPTVPLLLLALLPFAALVLVLVRLPAAETFRREDITPLALFDRRLRIPLIAALAAIMALGIGQVVVGFVVLDRFGVSDAQATRLTGIAMATLGVTLILSQFTVGLLNWPPARLMRIGAFVCTLGLLVATFAPNAAALVAAYAIFGLGGGWVYPAFLTLAANAVTADEQGRAAGTLGAAQGIGSTIGPLIGGVFYDVQAMLPFLIAAASTALILALTFFLRDDTDA